MNKVFQTRKSLARAQSLCVYLIVYMSDMRMCDILQTTSLPFKHPQDN